jgi:PKD repeat protein
VPGVYTVKLTVSDDDGDSGESVFQYIVVYDPTGGFVTGGAWIDSPAGAYVADPTHTGKLHVGFVAKYKKGATVPKGETESQLQGADLNFHSVSYDWLVVAPPYAFFQGSGTIDGAGNYGFLISAMDEKFAPDEDEDRFRLQIWDEGGAVVYDNQMGSGIYDNPTTPLGKGSIALHQVSAAAIRPDVTMVVVGNPPAALLARLRGTADGPNTISIFLPVIVP